MALDLDAGDVDLIRRAAPLHDVGKVGVPDGLLRKGGRLSLEETAVMRTHTTIGADILRSDHVRTREAVDEIVRHRGTQFDPAVVDVLVRLLGTGQLNRATDAPVLT